jgi:hypothetical protein
MHDSDVVVLWLWPVSIEFTELRLSPKKPPICYVLEVPSEDEGDKTQSQTSSLSDDSLSFDPIWSVGR